VGERLDCEERVNRRGFFATMAGLVVPFALGAMPERARQRVFEAQLSKVFEAGSDNKVIVIPRTKPTIDAMWRRYARSLK
jgi:hypothetical protein